MRMRDFYIGILMLAGSLAGIQTMVSLLESMARQV